MPDLVNHPSSQITKMLLMGDPGSGKTGSLAALAHAGYNLRIIDLDNGLDILSNLLRDPKSPYDKSSVNRVKYLTITEPHAKITTQGGAGVPAGATVWNRLVGALSNWPDKLGPIQTWGSKDVFVLDSMTLAGKAAYDFAAISTAGDRNRDGRMVYLHAQNYLEYLMQCLYADDVKCNVIVTAHISFIGDESNVMHGYPTTIGRALSSKIGRYFNSILLVKSDGRNHRIYTIPAVSRVELKTSSPLRVKEAYDIKHGLAEYFADVQVQPPALAAAQ